MIKKTLIGLSGLLLMAALSFPAFADQSIGYQEYFHKGVKAYQEHDDQEALRCFKIAQIYDSTNEELNNYISILVQKQITLEQNPSTTSPNESIGYKYYLAQGVEAYQNHDYKKAVRLFNIAIIFNPDSNEADQYLKDLSQSVNQQVTHVISQSPSAAIGNAPASTQAIEQSVSSAPQQSQEAQGTLQQAQPLPETLPSQPPTIVPPPPVTEPSNSIYVAMPKPKAQPSEILLSQISNNGQTNPKLQIELNSSVILVGRNIQRILVIDEGFIGVKTIGIDRLEIDAQKIGSTFIHIWDDQGRHTLFIEVVFPKPSNSVGGTQGSNEIQHSIPFKVIYTNDYDTYYSGKNISDLKRQSYEFNNTLAVSGETPYGFFDTSGSYTDYDSYNQFDTYTIGLTHIPLYGTSDFDLRGFDASRYMSELTLPTTRLRGAFADVDLMDNLVGLSVSHGQEQTPLGFIPMSQQTQFNNSYIDAVKLTLFPKSQTDQYSLNYATGYGDDREPYLANHVYSAEGQHKFNDFLTLDAEEGSDTSHDATLSSLKWQEGAFKTGLNFRNIDKSYSTISTLPSYQGETEAAWTTDADFKKFTEDTYFEVYRDRLDLNPDDSGAYNYDGNGQFHYNFTESIFTDTDFNYVDTPGEISPSRSLGLNQRISKTLGIWNNLKGTVFTGVGYQNSHSSDSDISDYSKEDAIAGFQLPITREVSTFANYEYDLLDQPDVGGKSYPSIINTGVEYDKQLTQKFSVNAQVSYHDELGVSANSESFLSGEQSVIITSGFSYNPTEDINIFADANASKEFPHLGNPSYDDIEFHLGMRITFGGITYWDPLGTVSGIVFKDRNGNGVYVKGDEGIPGVKVKVGDKFAVTDQNGRYHIQIRGKSVDVVPQIDTIPGGLLFSTPQVLNVPVYQGRITHADFGLTSQTGIYGIIFVSKKGLSVPSEGDQFIGKVKVILDGKITQKSDGQGTFYFRNITPGNHTISIDINSLAINMVPQVKLKNEINVAEGTNYMFNIPVQIKAAEGDQN